jgi:hypothetical protein
LQLLKALTLDVCRGRRRLRLRQARRQQDRQNQPE